ncbi:MAG: Stk1 family PASTA domain-containing Ser/Thr kinase [Oscillospiraceae bacterium]|nr:Stk1 family PASTA domain-containing Ser/Thr kinase [Oscillospiraceae bacterium]
MDEQDRNIGLVLEDRYELIEHIGEGGMAVVYKAKDLRLDRLVAVKIMRPEMARQDEFRQRFYAESHAVAMLSDPNIVAVFDVSHEQDIEYIVMELVQGITLKDYMIQKGPIPWKQAVYFAKQICRALIHAHERGVIHRDIKPQNMLLLRNGTLKVGDFGIAALENEMTEAKGIAIGSIHYMSPEQIRGESPDPRSDIYSLGVVMYEMLTDSLPFIGDTPGEIAVKHLNTLPVSICKLEPDVPQELEDIVAKAMQTDIDRRYQSASEMLEALDRFTLDQARQEDEAKAVELETPSVVPVRSVSEMSQEQYQRRRKRSSRVTFLAGTFGVLVTLLALAIFLFNYFLRDLFTEAERVIVPDFHGKSYEDLLRDPQNAIYRFEIVLLSPGATIVDRQEPAAGTRENVDSDGISVRLYVRSNSSQVPDVFNMDYREATAILRMAGYYAEIVDQVSEEYARNMVMGISPEAGQELPQGSVVYLTVSAGPEIQYVTVPNLVGLSEVAAIGKIESSELSYGGSEYTRSDLPAGTVIGQSAEAFGQMPSHGKIILRVSTGPEEG